MMAIQAQVDSLLVMIVVRGVLERFMQLIGVLLSLHVLLLVCLADFEYSLIFECQGLLTSCTSLCAGLDDQPRSR